MPEGNIYTRIAFESGEPRHVYVHAGKSGGALACAADALSRALSCALQHGAPATELAASLRGAAHDRTINRHGHEAASMPDAVAQALLQVAESAE